MGILGKTISYPFRPDISGGAAITLNGDEIIVQGIIDLIETRQGERVMLPSYGLPDLIFDALDAGFAARLAFYIEEQIRNYFPAIENVSAEAGSSNGTQFFSDGLPTNHTAAVRVRWTKGFEAVPQELIYPTWRLSNI